VLTTRAVQPDLERERVEPLLMYRETPPPPVSAPRQAVGSAASVVDGADAIRVPRLSLPTVGVPAIDVPLTLTPLAPMAVRGDWPEPGAPRGASMAGIYQYAYVDRPATARRGNDQPRYPAPLRAALVEGEVLVKFVVDTLGRVEPGSVEIVRAAHPLFGEAVADWLPRNRYNPARVDGRPVRQLVEQRIAFSLVGAVR
jgi:TonB family protein